MTQQYINKRYKIEKAIGEGGMGLVLLATDQKHNCQVAIKNIHPDQINIQSIERLKREALYLSKISHPNIVRVYDFFEENKQFYLVMEYVQGKTLEEIIYRDCKLTSQEKLLISYQLVSAIRTMNLQGLVHRDIKPSNILYVAKGQYVKLLDLGIAKSLIPQDETSNLTKTNAILGTPGYMSPEQVNGKTTKRSDVFTVATVIYQLFANLSQSPFLGNNNLNTMLKVSTFELTPLKDIIEKRFPHSTKLSRLLECALEKDSHKRIDIDVFFREMNSIMGMHQPTREIKVRKPHIRKIQRITNDNKASKKVIFSMIFVFLLGFLFLGISSKQEIHSHKKFALIMKSFSQNKFKDTWKQNKLFMSQFPLSPYPRLLKSLMLRRGLGVSRQIYESDRISSKWYKQIENKQDVYALYLQAKIYFHGIGVKKDLVQALKSTLSATKKFYPLAFTCLGKIYLEQQNDLAAVQAFEKGTSLGEIESMHQLGLLYFQGTKVEKDGKKALELLNESFEKGNIYAASSIGYLYFYGTLSVPQNNNLATQWFETGAKYKSAVCLNNLAAVYLDEHGKKAKPRKSLAEIAHIFNQSATQNYHLAMRALGNMHIRYFTNYYQGLYWLIKAKKEGNRYAQNDIFNLTKSISLSKIQEQVLLKNNYARYVLSYWFMEQEKLFIDSFYWLITAHHHDTQNLNIIDDIVRYIEDEKIAGRVMNPSKKDKNTHVVLGFLYEKGIGFDMNKKLALQHYKKAITLGEKSSKIRQKIIR
ncbi:protein kinase [Candidatus Uabimicrobium sp. HlEnr_7]|uniref:protein kinase domain-containing protein n=1 Tax=Candidatus Uabimicrobium helgolandensis TaxID=3095367 RepID=UPI003557771C